MYTNNDLPQEICRKLLKQAAWRIQYKIRIQHIRESIALLDYQTSNYSFEAEIISQIYVKEIVNSIPWEKSRYVIQKNIIEGLTEKEIANELQISQQAVNKWKKKGLAVLRQNLYFLNVL